MCAIPIDWTVNWSLCLKQYILSYLINHHECCRLSPVISQCQRASYNWWLAHVESSWNLFIQLVQYLYSLRFDFSSWSIFQFWFSSILIISVAFLCCVTLLSVNIFAFCEKSNWAVKWVSYPLYCLLEFLTRFVWQDSWKEVWRVLFGA
jgi:hypothetical protein